MLNIKRIRGDLSQLQFANLLGVSVRTLQEWEQGRRVPNAAAVALLKSAQSKKTEKAMIRMNEPQEVLGLCYDALKSNALSMKEAKVLSACMGDFIKLAVVQTDYFVTRGQRLPIPKIPTLRTLLKCLQNSEYSIAAQKAHEIRAAMKPIINAAKEQLKT